MLERKLTVTIDADRLQARYRDELARQSKNVKHMRGFRPGKIPARAIEQLVGDPVRKMVIRSLVQDSLGEVIKEQNLRPVFDEIERLHRLMADEEWEDWEEKPDGSVEYVVEMEVLPEIKFPSKKVSKLKLVRYSPAVNDADVDVALEQIRDDNPNWEPAGVPAEREHRLTCDFSGRIAGEPFPGGDSSGYEFVLGEGAAIPGFEEQLEGLSSGDEKSFELDIPESHPNEKVRGKRVEFGVKVLKVERAVPSEINDDLAARVSPQDEDEPYTLEVLREKVREHLQEKLEDMLHQRTRNQLLKVLEGAVRFPVPKVLLDKRLDALREGEEDAEEGEKSDGGADAEGAEEAAAGPNAGDDAGRKLTFREKRAQKKAAQEQKKRDDEQVGKAEAELRAMLLLAHIAEEQNIQVEGEEVHAEIERRVQQLRPGEHSDEYMKMFYENEQLLSSVASNVREKKTIAAVLEQAGAEVQELGYEETLELLKAEVSKEPEEDKN